MNHIARYFSHSLALVTRGGALIRYIYEVKLIVFILALLTLTLPSFAQKQGNVWCFGFTTGIDFNDTANPIPVNTVCRNQQGAASTCDASGNLLFYFADDTLFTPNTGTVRNGQHQTISNGDLMKCYSKFTNGCMFLPVDDKYYLLSIASDSQTAVYQSLYCNTIHHSSNGDSVVVKNIHLLDIPLEWKISATKQANGTDWWVIVHRAQPNFFGGIYDPLGCNNTYYTYSITDNGVAFVDSQHIGIPRCSNVGVYGEMTFSRSGRLLARTIEGANAIQVCRFNRCTGFLDNPVDIDSVGDRTVYPYGIEFSPDETKLYVMCSFANSASYSELYQFNLLDTNIPASKMLLGKYRTDTLVLGELQLAPDGKIYAANHVLLPANKINTIGVINNPNERGLACDFDPYGFNLGAVSDYSLPNNPNYDLGPMGIYAANAGKDVTICKDSSTTAILGSPPVADLVYSWYPPTGLSDISAAQPNAQPNSSTRYYLTVTDTTGTSCIQTKTDSVYVQVIKCDTLSVNEAATQPIKVHPSPANHNLTIELTENGLPMQCDIYNVLGQEILHRTLMERITNVDISSIPDGLYLYRIHGSNISQSGKVMVAH